MNSDEIRSKFIQFFKDKGHTHVPSSPLIPFDDPTLLFINAGMNQFKEIFLGQKEAPYSKAVSAQKCVRAGGKHNDLENVGHTSRHLTFFEMLGNFSFGDYFKKEAIDFAFTLSTEVFALDPEKIWASVFEEDDEAFELWKKYLPEKRIVRLGEKDNFWMMGETGPCGPCSELLFDKGANYSSATNPKDDHTGERFFEFWNLVFMQQERDKSGKLKPLPQKHIDTGAGLERIVSLKMGVDNVFETDLLRSLIAEVENHSKKKYDPQGKLAPAFHVIADHIRTLAFSIADGALPSNIDRGYVLRKILRRAVRYGRTLGFTTPFLSELFPRLGSLMGSAYPELLKAETQIVEVLFSEEESFFRTLQRGGQLLSQVIAESQGEKAISGDDAFKLKDTYGLPLDEIELIAKDEHLTVDRKRFFELEKKAKEISKKAHKKSSQEVAKNLFENFHEKSFFYGYDKESLQAEVIAIVQDGNFIDELSEGDALIILNKTPFYAEMGGQVGDTGALANSSAIFVVDNTLSYPPGVIAHHGKLKSGHLKKGDKLEASIDHIRRKEIRKNHTATHILHWALTELLGEHIRQAGSLVDDEHIRFDFTHHKALSKEEIYQLERMINQKIAENRKVASYEKEYEEIKQDASIKQFFGEKYGKTVRVIDIDFSKELCGGTHTDRTGDIALFVIEKETSIAKGVRRIEALTGKKAIHHIQERDRKIHALQEMFKAPEHLLIDQVLALIEERNNLIQDAKQKRKEELEALQEALLKKGSTILEIVPLSSKEVAPFADELIKKVDNGLIALGIVDQGRCHLVIRMHPNSKHDALQIIKEVAPLIQGGGGGKKHAAQAGGKDPSKLQEALLRIKELI